MAPRWFSANRVGRFNSFKGQAAVHNCAVVYKVGRSYCWDLCLYVIQMKRINILGLYGGGRCPITQVKATIATKRISFTIVPVKTVKNCIKSWNIYSCNMGNRIIKSNWDFMFNCEVSWFILQFRGFLIFVIRNTVFNDLKLISRR